MRRPFASTYSVTPPRSFLRLALHVARERLLDPEVATPVVEQRHRVQMGIVDVVDACDEEVVVARAVRVDDFAFEGRDRPFEQRQAALAWLPGGAAERLAIRRHWRTRETVRQRLLALAQHVDGEAAFAVDRRGDEA